MADKTLFNPITPPFDKVRDDLADLGTKNHSDLTLNNNQDHTDYLINNGDDTSSGTITAAGFTTAGTVQAEQLTSTDDCAIADDLDVGGQMALGLYAAPTTGQSITIIDYFNLNSSNVYGIYALPIVAITSNSSYASAALNFVLPLTGAGNLTNPTGHWGVMSGVSDYTSGATNVMGGIDLYINPSAGTCTTAYGMRVRTTSNVPITDYYQIHLGTKVGTGAITNYWGIYQEDANATNYFAGDIQIDDATLEFQEGSDTLSITVPALTSDRAVTFGDLDLDFDQDVSSGANPTFGVTNFTDASVSAQGVVELATAAETDTGTDATRAVTPDGLQGSKRNIRWLVFDLIAPDTDCAADTNIGGDFVSPIAGTILQDDSSPFYIYATNSTAGSTGTMVVDININGTTIMTTNKLDFDTGEKTTTTASTPPDLTTTSLAVGDIITIDVDSIHTTAAKGLKVYIAIRES